MENWRERAGEGGGGKGSEDLVCAVFSREQNYALRMTGGGRRGSFKCWLTRCSVCAS